MKNRKKVVHIVEAFAGGIFSYLVDLVNNTSDEFDVVILYSIRKETPENFKNYFDSKVKLIELKHLKRKIGINDIKAFFEVKKILKGIQPDIVHCHSSKAGIVGRFASNGHKQKVFYTPHGYSFLKLDDSKSKRFIYKFIEKLATVNKSTIVACSKGEYEESLKLTKNSCYINNGVNLEYLKKYIPETPKEFDNKSFTVVTTGRIAYQKNPELLNKIAESFPNIKFVWVGDGELKNQLVSKNIEVTGWKNKNELIEILNKSDIFILTSLWEGLSISLLEAMALKKVCIVSNCIGNKDVIINNKNGFVCKDYIEFCNIISDIQNKKYNLEDIQMNAYFDIKKEYNTKIMCRRYTKLYKGELK